MHLIILLIFIVLLFHWYGVAAIAAFLIISFIIGIVKSLASVSDASASASPTDDDEPVDCNF